MNKHTVTIATHPDLISSEEWSALIGKCEGSLKRDANTGHGPKRVRIGNRAYYHRPECDEYIRNLFEGKTASEIWKETH